MICTFFGHSDTPNSIGKALEEAIVKLIEEKGVSKFYVGDSGKFDFMVQGKLDKIKKAYPEIEYWIVLSRMPNNTNLYLDFDKTVLPDKVASAPARFAIDRRNHWMVENSDFAIVYVAHSWGGAAKFKAVAERKKLEVINLFNQV